MPPQVELPPPQILFARPRFTQGYPLWNPEPPNSQNPEHQREGLRIGDVGTIDAYGGFKVFFNILDRNTETPADTLSEVSIDHNNTYKSCCDIPLRDVVASPRTSWIPSVLDDANPTIQKTIYEARLSCDGSHIILPQGAKFFALEPDHQRQFVIHAMQRGASWLERSRVYLRSSPSNSLYLLTGFHKTCSWAIASFSMQGAENANPVDALCRLEEIDKLLVLQNSIWHPAGRFACKIGPPQDRQSDPNQTIFIQAIVITPGSGLSKAWGGVVDSVFHAATQLGNTFMGSTAEALAQARPSKSNVRLQHVPPWQAFHPSEIINRYLLKKEPSARIAVTHDSVWISMIKRDQFKSWRVEDFEKELDALIPQDCSIVTREDVVYLEDKGHGSASGHETSRLCAPADSASSAKQGNLKQSCGNPSSHCRASSQAKPGALGGASGFPCQPPDLVSQLSGLSIQTKSGPLYNHLQPFDAEKATQRHSCARTWFAKYEQGGRASFLDEAIIRSKEAVRLFPPAHPSRPMCLSDRGRYVHARHKLLGSTTDLNDAINLANEALRLFPQRHPGRLATLLNLVSCLHTRYKQDKESSDINDAVAHTLEALDLCPRKNPDYSSSLSNIAFCLSVQYNQPGGKMGLDKVISLAQEALDICPHRFPDRPTALSNLARCLSSRYKQFGDIGDLDRAIRYAEEALQSCPDGHLTRTDLLLDLAEYLNIRFSQSHRRKDKEDLSKVHTKLAPVPQTVSSSYLSATKAWVETAKDDHPTMLRAYETSLHSLTQHLAPLPPLPQNLPVFKECTSSLAVDAFSACVRGGSHEIAVELSEQGRGVFWNQISRLRPPLDDVIKSGPTGKKLAEDFSQISSEICDVINTPADDQHDMLCHLNVRLQVVANDIRQLPGFANFLPRPLFSTLQGAARDGPVIIVNASKSSCDALIISIDKNPVHIPLQLITRAMVQDMSSSLHALISSATMMADITAELVYILRRLWDLVVSPIVTLLQKMHYPIGSRIWWCPTADFCLLPLHAAGSYRNGQDNLLHLYISSYTPTLTALIHAQRQNPSNSTAKGKRFLAIGPAPASAKFAKPKPSPSVVGRELVAVGRRVEGFTSFTRIEDQESTITRVSEELVRNEWMHLACDGIFSQNQLFEHHNGRFAILQILRHRLPNPEFAYLSGSRTAVGDEGNLDEMIHLASAMLSVGFRSIIATMWDVDGRHTERFASTFYENMVDRKTGRLDHRQAAIALNKTMNELVDLPLYHRIQYVHIGV